jgi:hypothetical protein
VSGDPFGVSWEQELAAAADLATMAREMHSHETERGTVQAVCELARDLLKPTMRPSPLWPMADTGP